LQNNIKNKTMTTIQETKRSQIITIAVVMIAAFMDLVDNTSVSLAIPSIAESLKTTNSSIQWIIAGNVLALGVGLIIGGRLGDKYGRKNIFLIGLSGYVLTSILCAAALNDEALLAARVFQGMSGALMIPQIFGIIRASLDHKQQVIAYGVYGGVLSLAAIVGPLLGGILVDWNLFGLGWRTIFLINVPVGIIGFLLGVRNLENTRDDRAQRIDYVGALLFGAGVFFILYPLVQSSEIGWPVSSFIILALSVPVFLCFQKRSVRLENAHKSPLIPKQLLENKTFLIGLLVSLLFFAGISVFFLLLSLYLIDGTSRSTWQASLVILPYAIGSIITSGIGVQFANKAGRKLLVGGSIMIALSMAWLWLNIYHGNNTSYWELSLPMFIGGLGIGLTSPILINVILSGVNVQQSGTASGVLNTITQIGAATGVAVLATFFFSVLQTSFIVGQNNLAAYSSAFVAVLPWLAVLYTLVGALMFYLPANARDVLLDKTVEVVPPITVQVVPDVSVEVVLL
jgi:EmrB/QacA subfamily drug resistance transporter